MSRPPKSRQFGLEMLENRQLMAANLIADQLRLTADPSADGQYILTVQGTTKNDNISLVQKNGNLVVQMNKMKSAPFELGSISRFIADGGDGNDTISLKSGKSGIALNAILLGGVGNDTLRGGSLGSLLDGGPGNDKLYGLDGSDMLVGGDGNDKLDAGNNDDMLFGGSGNDTLNGKSGRDFMVGGAGTNRLGNQNAEDFMATEDVDLFDQALTQWSPYHQFQSFTKDVLAGLPTIELPSGLDLSVQVSIGFGPWQVAYDTNDGWNASRDLLDAKGATIAGTLGQDGLSGSISGNGMIGPIPVTGSMSYGTSGQIQGCLGPGQQWTLLGYPIFSASVQGCASYTPPSTGTSTSNTLTYDDNAPKGGYADYWIDPNIYTYSDHYSISDQIFQQLPSIWDGTPTYDPFGASNFWNSSPTPDTSFGNYGGYSYDDNAPYGSYGGYDNYYSGYGSDGYTPSVTTVGRDDSGNGFNDPWSSDPWSSAIDSMFGYGGSSFTPGFFENLFDSSEPLPDGTYLGMEGTTRYYEGGYRINTVDPYSIYQLDGGYQFGNSGFYGDYGAYGSQSDGGYDYDYWMNALESAVDAYNVRYEEDYGYNTGSYSTPTFDNAIDLGAYWTEVAHRGYW